jgi:uncharacterized RDD family membrane protein YckC
LSIHGHKCLRAGFWRRLAATWIDAFVVYAVTALLVALAAATRIRIALEPLFVAVAAVYGVVLLARWRQTVGKTLMGITVVTRAGSAPGVRQAVFREVLGKWGATVVVPVVLGRILVGRTWVPTVYDLLAPWPALLLLLIYCLLAKRTWYDALAGTEVRRWQGANGEARPAFLALLGAALVALGVTTADFATHGWIPCRLALYRSMRSTAPYVAFLAREQVAPVDYVIDLFDRYDVVVLCERLHDEASQWDFIYEIVRDPRFIERVGHVFTEYGTVGMQPHLDSLMAADDLDAKEVRDRIAHIMRNWAVWPSWDNTNFYRYLTRLYALNQSLRFAKRVHHHFTDVSVDWSSLTTREDYTAYWRSLGGRDRQMARRVIEEMGRLAESAPMSPKCLVVMNYRHAFDLTGRSPRAQRHNTYEYLKDAFADRAANVLLNTWFVVLYPLAGGAWDRAFEETSHRLVGFDFDGSPFGEDPFDLFPFELRVRGRLRYRDVFTGFVYANPLESQYRELGVPGLYQGFEEEMLRRAGLLGDDYRQGVKVLIELEAKGHIPLRQGLPNHSVESLFGLFLLGVFGVGLLLGSAAFV